MMIIDPFSPIVFGESAAPGEQIVRRIDVRNVLTDDIQETGTLVATLGAETATANVPITLLTPNEPTFTVTSTPNCQLEVTSYREKAVGIYEVTLTATKL